MDLECSHRRIDISRDCSDEKNWNENILTKETLSEGIGRRPVELNIVSEGKDGRKSSSVTFSLQPISSTFLMHSHHVPYFFYNIMFDCNYSFFHSWKFYFTFIRNNVIF